MTLGRPPKDDDATGKRRPEDETQKAEAGTLIGKLPKDEVLAAFRTIARVKS